MQKQTIQVDFKRETLTNLTNLIIRLNMQSGRGDVVRTLLAKSPPLELQAAQDEPQIADKEAEILCQTKQGSKNKTENRQFSGP